MKIFPVFIPQQGCKFQCIYCNQFSITGSQGIDEKKITGALESFCNKHSALNKEIAFFGGTFTALSKELRNKYYTLIKPFLNELTTIRYSTRPDAINEEILIESSLNHVTTIELGIQSFSDSELFLSGRGYNRSTALKACNLIKEHGFQLGIQLMLGLPGFNRETFLESLNETLRIKPSFVRIYPLLVLRETPLEKMYRAGEYKPLGIDEAIDYSVELITALTGQGINVIKIGLHSDIEGRDAILAGPFHANFGELVKGELLARKIEAMVSDECILAVSDKNISLLKGNGGHILKRLENRCQNKIINVTVDTRIPDGEFIITHIVDKD
jgi:histone acetyltransferase (RNA polymerase elongator complex component)